MLSKARLRTWLGFGLPFIVACGVTFGSELAAEYVIHSGEPGYESVTQSIFDLTWLYQAVVAWGPRPPIPRYTVIVRLDSSAPSYHELCDQRSFLARLIRALESLEPSVIVLDKYFHDSCGADTDLKFRLVLEDVG